MGPFVKRSIFVGYDRREAVAFSVAMGSAGRHLSTFVPLHGLFLDYLIDKGLYRRPLEYRDGVMWDVISDAPMATQHANARFLVKEIAKEGWAVFMDGDVLVMDDMSALFDQLDPKFAVYCVKHDYSAEPGVKMDGQIQTAYAKKNWSSVMAVNCDHPSNAALTLDLINSVPGRELHRFCWLKEEEIGALDPSWNYLVGVTPRPDKVRVAHFTLGLPDMPGYEDCEFAEQWRKELNRKAA